MQTYVIPTKSNSAQGKEEFSFARSSTVHSHLYLSFPSLLPPHFSCPSTPICFGQSFSF